MRRLGGDMDALREVRHTNLVSVMQFDKRAGAVVYEFVPGGTLTQLLDGHGPLELAASLVLLEDTISGLEALHNAGVLHRNLTPDAVVVETTGAVLLRDAGLAETPVPAGQLPEQRPYLAPEVLAGGAPTSAADLYAATAVFVESLGGRASKAAIRVDLRPLLNEGMAKDPSKRSPTFDHFRRELDDYARATIGESWRKDGRALLTVAAAGQATRGVPVASPAETPADSATEATATVALLRTPSPRSPRVWVGLGSLGVAALVAILVLARTLSPAQAPNAPFGGFFNGLPFIPQSTPTASPLPAGVLPATSAGTNPPAGVVPPITTPTPTKNPAGLPPPPSTPPPNPALLSQSINWTSSAPTGATYGGSYRPSALGGQSGNPVVFNSLTTLVCKSLAGTIDYVGVGACEIDATQAGNSRYNAAPTKTMGFTIAKASQTIAITSTPSSPTYGGSYTVTGSAKGGAVTFSADASSAACNVSSTGAVSFTAAGACVIDANQPGGADYLAASQIQQQFDVSQATQSIGFTSTAPTCPCTLGQQYTVTATGGGSGNPVTFNIDPSSTALICTIAGSTVTISGGLPGTCIIDAFQAGNANYSAAPQVQQTINVS